MEILRFAPSPTGEMHAGNIRLAVLNYLYAQKTGATLILRMDDTDIARSKEEFKQGIIDDLAWLGITYDRTEYQSKNFDQYNAKFDELVAQGRIYACYETPDELEYMRNKLLAQKKPPIYDRGALNLTPEQIATYEAEGRKPHYRFKLIDGTIEWDDKIKGHVSFQASTLSDPIIRKADGTYLYMLPSTIDDVNMGVTLVMRGEDHVSNTPIQMQMFDAFGAKRPECAHYPLIRDMDGSKLSKRMNSLSIKQLRESYMSPLAVMFMVASIGNTLNIDDNTTLQDVINQFDFSKFSKSSSKFNENELYNLNAMVLKKTPYHEVSESLKALDIQITPDVWEVVKFNITVLSDLKIWQPVFNSDETYKLSNADDIEFVKKCIDLLPAEPWDDNVWKTWTTGIKTITDRKGKSLFLPLRMAITGQERGPNMHDILKLLGRDKVLHRLQSI